LTLTPDLPYWLALEAVPGLGPEAVRRLLERFGGVQAIFSSPLDALRGCVSQPLAEAIGASRPEPGNPAFAVTLDWLAAPDAHFIPCTDPTYPAALAQTPGAPAWLYVKGDPGILAQPMLAIVGSRNATPQGRRDAAAFAQTLAEAGLTVVSGLAEGIDTAAHEGGLTGNGRGVAVVGTGLDRVYPARNRALAHRLAASGCIVSEFPLGTPPRPGHFPRRNRVISGLALGVLVIEAAPQSGSLITARLAAEQGREVFALPGSIHSPLSRGCHRLIKDGAKLVESAADILDELAWQWSPPARADWDDDSGPKDDPILALLGPEPVSLDALVAASGLTVDRLSAILLAHELDGRIAALPGGLYQRLYPGTD